MDPTYNYNYQGNVPPEAAAGIFAFLGGLMLFMVILFVVVYVIVAVSLMRIAKRTNTENAWFAWIPILNLILMLQIAQRPMWWLIFFLVPFINIVGIVLQFVIWVDIAKRLGKQAWVGILAGLIPIIFVPYLAFSGSDSAPASA
ncbi:MAG: hypothetical protein A3J76_01050 [Candidatus Moranbacteria bacterium RBG_13_45_13]|nr:MAG: hypothetical protein A3J76_01050 [Candidatus Moranbacteria bacterium RBG_13_45_13]